MSALELGPWEPLDVEAVVHTFAAAPFRWWISGGRALELHLGRSWRDHDDTDVGVSRRDLGALYKLLEHWHVHVAADGRLTPWRGEPLVAEAHQNNLWCRIVAGGPWVLDITIGEGDDHRWIYRRDQSIQLPWDEAVLRTGDGVPYLAPHLQLLFKSKGRRPKDEVDAAEVIPQLSVREREQLRRYLDADHPWRRRAISLQ